MAAVEYSTQANAAINSKNAHLEPNEVQGRKRVAFFDYTVQAVDVLLAILCLLPAGRLRCLLPESYVEVNGSTVGATISIGYAQHTDQAGATVAADADAFADNINFTAAASPQIVQLGNVATADVPAAYPLLDSRDGVQIAASRLDAAWNVGDTLKGIITYVND